jgi:transposase
MSALSIRRDCTPAVLRKLAKGESDARITRRILAIANALDGMSREAAAQAAGMDRQTLCDWVIRYNEDGLDGLADRARDGRPPKLDAEEKAELYRLVLFALVMHYANTEAMQQFLNDFAATIVDDEHVVMVLDQAGWHDSRALRAPAKVTLVALPPYSPELNPVERVWPYLKERFLSHRLHDDYEAIVNAACKAWRRLTAQAGRIKSLCTYLGRWLTPRTEYP